MAADGAVDFVLHAVEQVAAVMVVARDGARASTCSEVLFLGTGGSRKRNCSHSRSQQWLSLSVDCELWDSGMARQSDSLRLQTIVWVVSDSAGVALLRRSQSMYVYNTLGLLLSSFFPCFRLLRLLLS
jgi:hypothetical protein